MRLNSLKEIIRIWGTWKSVMGLQVRAFKSCKKWTPAYKYYWQWKVFWIYNHPPLQKQSNKDWNTPIPLENSGPSIKDSLIFPFLAMTFNSCFHHQLWVKLVCIHIGNSSGYITQTHSRFPKWLWMFDTEWNTHRIDIFWEFIRWLTTISSTPLWLLICCKSVFSYSMKIYLYSMKNSWH